MNVMIQSTTSNAPLRAENEDKTIASYITQDFITLSVHLDTAQARTKFIESLQSNEIPSHIFLIDKGALRGILPVKRMLEEKNPEMPIRDLMETLFFHAEPTTLRSDLVQELRLTGMDIVPIIENNHLVGALNERQIDRIIEDEATEDAQLQGGSSPLDKPYLETSPFVLWRKRVVWLLFLFVAEAYTSNVLQHFENELEAVTALAFFIPLLIGTGGNSGTQITTTIVRSMAIGQIQLRDLGKILFKEMSTASMIAITLGAAGILRSFLMPNIGWNIIYTVSLALMCISLWSALVSSVTPLLLKRIGIDPAVVSGPFICTLIDGTGLIIYFELAKIMIPTLHLV